jgi:hypothetical protein
MHPADSFTVLSPDPTSNEASWPSVFWPVIACTFAVVLQNTGRVCGAKFRASGTLKTCVLVCAADSVFMLVGLLEMLLHGCSFQIAVTYVWQARFQKEADSTPLGWIFSGLGPETGQPDSPIRLDGSTQIADQLRPDSTGHVPQSSSQPTKRGRVRTDDIAGPSQEQTNSVQPCPEPTSSTLYPGSDIDATWRMSMTAFVLGSLPQAIKVFSMRGVIYTQAIVGILLAHFFLAEMFRLVTVATVKPRPGSMPTTEFAAKWRPRAQSAVLHAILLILLACLSTMAGAYSSILSVLGSILWFIGTVSLLSIDTPARISVYAAVLLEFEVGRWVSTFDVLYRLLFMGPYSRLPRLCCGLQGNLSERNAGLFVLANLVAYFEYYRTCYSSVGTYKPSWADNLG